MILAIDTCYRGSSTKTVGFVFEHWADETPAQVYTEILEDVAEYIAGEFYKRELPCILSMFAVVDLSRITFILVDGYVFLDDRGRAWLARV